MNNGRANIWLCKAFALAFILNVLRIGQSHALYSPVYDYPMTITEATSLGDGGKDIQPSTLRIREHKLDFTLPDIPQIALNPTTGELELTDADGNPRTIQIDLPENAPYESIFPMIVTDDKGNSYQLTPAEQHTDAEDNAGQQGKVPLQADRVERVGDFNTETLSDRYGQIGRAHV